MDTTTNPAPHPSKNASRAAARLLESHVEYHYRITNVYFGHLSGARSWEAFLRFPHHGRRNLVRAVIGALMGLEEPPSMYSPYLFDERIGWIRCKTFLASPDPSARLASGPHKGELKVDQLRIELSPVDFRNGANSAPASGRPDRCDAFMFIDLGRLQTREVSFITLPITDVAADKQGIRIAESAIRARVARTQRV